MTITRDDTVQSKTVKKVSVWRNRDYVLLWCGQAISTIGGSVSDLAFPLLVLAVTSSPAQAGITAALRALPATLFTLPGGVLVDRWDRKRVMLFCEVGRFLSLASIPLALTLNHLTLYQLYITSFVEGTLAILFRLAHMASLGQVVAREQLAAAITQEELMEGTTALCGPSLSGLLFTFDRALPFVADAISYAASIVTFLLIRTPFQGARATTRPHLLVEMREGVACSHWRDLCAWRRWLHRWLAVDSFLGEAFDCWTIHAACALELCADLTTVRADACSAVDGSGRFHPWFC